MDESKARKVLGTAVLNDNRLISLGHYIYWNPERNADTVTLDSEFTMDEIEAIAWWMRNKRRR